MIFDCLISKWLVYEFHKKSNDPEIMTVTDMLQQKATKERIF